MNFSQVCDLSIRMNNEHTLSSKRVSMLAPPIPVSAASPFDAGKPLNFDEYGVRALV
jgi:hypothetical protein